LPPTFSSLNVIPPPTPTPTIYEVKRGETLGTIALQFGVSVDAIIAVNGITDPNRVGVGQKLIIPVSGLSPTATPPFTPLPTTTLASGTESPPQLAVRAINDLGNLQTERVMIVNLGGLVNLSGWTLRDQQNNVYTFPNIVLFQGGAVNVHTIAGRDTVTDLYWGKTTAMWQNGETATLVDPQGRTHTTFTAP
jgi:LysM repeat protein